MPMYCKKCGTEQKENQKFCPKCGTPYSSIEKGEVLIETPKNNKHSIFPKILAIIIGLVLDKEAQRVVKSMPHWIPERQNGSPVRVKYTVPVTFRLQ
ncbi:zinc-ribbon domain-containing protein [Prevotella sp. ne3005]|nr:zinc-ribbon domain-containing protein [Prevotella sp. ne3005]